MFDKAEQENSFQNGTGYEFPTIQKEKGSTKNQKEK